MFSDIVKDLRYRIKKNVVTKMTEVVLSVTSERSDLLDIGKFNVKYFAIFEGIFLGTHHADSFNRSQSLSLNSRKASKLT